MCYDMCGGDCLSGPTRGWAAVWVAWGAVLGGPVAGVGPGAGGGTQMAAAVAAPTRTTVAKVPKPTGGAGWRLNAQFERLLSHFRFKR